MDDRPASDAPALPDGEGRRGPGGPPLAEPGRRLAAAAVDGLLFVLAAVPGMVVFALTADVSAEHPFGANGTGWGVMGLGLLALAAVQAWRLGTTGQTLAKRAFGLRVVDATTGRHPGFVRAVLLRYGVLVAVAYVPEIGMVVLLAAVLSMFRDDRRGLHDHIAQTVVVSEADSTY